jgi:hypothetical protein
MEVNMCGYWWIEVNAGDFGRGLEGCKWTKGDDGSRRKSLAMAQQFCGWCDQY